MDCRMCLVYTLVVLSLLILWIDGQAVTSCAGSPCRNGASCEDTDTGYQCVCIEGFVGDNCEIHFDDCSGEPCGNGGTCRDDAAGYTCVCVSGYTGGECQIDIDECESNPCLMDGTCVDLIDGFTCECPPPYKGHNCSLLPCDIVPCENEAVCEDDVTFNRSLTGHVCNCGLGFSGLRCEINLEDCDVENDTSCTGNGLCVDGINDYSCLCEPGWIGEFCQQPVDDCIGNDCRNNGICTDQHLGYSCICPAGFEGDLCERERDECTTWSACQNEAECFDLFNDYRCECNSAWMGENCTEEADECLTNRCENGGQCLDIVGGYTCRCPPFFTGALCETAYNPCSPEYNPCQNGANCIVPPDGNYLCFCTTGFTGVNCEVNLNECLLYPCDNNATCEDITAGYVCHCRMGWAGEQCTINIDDCLSQPCSNGATCFDVLNGFHCNCTSEYTGRLCEEPVDFCLQTPCYNDGTCLRLIGDYQCQCMPPYTGRNCLEMLNGCESSPCLNNGTCLNTDDGGYECVCKTPYTGPTCGIITNHCASQPCFNGGSCRQLKDSWVCICPVYLTGPQCTDLVDYCKDGPCLNGAVCINNEFGFRCMCLYGYTGNLCADQIDFCSDSPCLNSANCSNVPGGFVCNCSEDHIGDLCESKVTITPSVSISMTVTTITSADRSIPLSSSFQTLYSLGISSSELLSNNDVFSVTESPISIYVSSIKKDITDSENTHMVQTSSFMYSQYVGRTDSSMEAVSSFSNYAMLSYSSTLSSTSSMNPSFMNSVELFTSADVYSKITEVSVSSKTPYVPSSTNLQSSSKYFPPFSVSNTHWTGIIPYSTSIAIEPTTAFESSTDFIMSVTVFSDSVSNVISSRSSTYLHASITSTLELVIPSVSYKSLSDSVTESLNLESSILSSSSSFQLQQSPSEYSTYLRSSHLQDTPSVLYTSAAQLVSSSSIVDNSEQLISLTSTVSVSDIRKSISTSSAVISSFINLTHSMYEVHSSESERISKLSTLIPHSTDSSTSVLYLNSNNFDGTSFLSETVLPSRTIESPETTFMSVIHSVSVFSSMRYTVSMSSNVNIVSTTFDTYVTPRISSVLTDTGSASHSVSERNISQSSNSALSSVVSMFDDGFSSFDTQSIKSMFISSVSYTELMSTSYIGDTSTESLTAQSTNSMALVSSLEGSINQSIQSSTEVTTKTTSSISNSKELSHIFSNTGSSSEIQISSLFQTTVSSPAISEVSLSFFSTHISTSPITRSDIHMSSSYESFPTTFVTLKDHTSSEFRTAISSTSVESKTVHIPTFTSVFEDFSRSLSISFNQSTFGSVVSPGVDFKTNTLSVSSIEISSPFADSTLLTGSSSELYGSTPSNEYPLSTGSSVSISPTSKLATSYTSVPTPNYEVKSSTNTTKSFAETQNVFETVLTAMTSSSVQLSDTSSEHPSVSSRLASSHAGIPTSSLRIHPSFTDSTINTEAIVTTTPSDISSLISAYPAMTTTPQSIYLTATTTAGIYINHSFIDSTFIRPSQSSLMPESSTIYTGETTTQSTSSTSTSTSRPPPSQTCDNFQCQNGGVCRRDMFGIYCDCTEGFVGLFCEKETIACDGLLCENGGICSIVMTIFNQPVPTCSCPLPYTGTLCDQELFIVFPAFHGQSYLLFPSPRILATTTNELILSIKTTQSNGTILFSRSEQSTETTTKTNPSFIHLYIEKGRLRYRFSCDGVMIANIETNLTVNTGDVYGIIIRQMWSLKAGDWCSASLTVNTITFVSTPVLTGSTPHPLGELIIGGIVRYNYDQEVIVSTDVINGYVGCVRNLQINGVEIDLVKMSIRGINVENCNVPICQNDPCKNGATCHSVAEDWYCECTPGYGGDLCETRLCETNPCYHGGTCVVLEAERDTLCVCPYGRGGLLCEHVLRPAVPHFSGTLYGLTSYIAFSNVHYMQDNFQMEFDLIIDGNSTRSNLIMYMGDTNTNEGRSDFFVLGLVQGYLLFRFDLGSGQGDIYSQDEVDLNLPHHHIKLGRDGRTGWLQLDDQTNVTGRSNGLLTALNVRTDLYVGGLELSNNLLVSPLARFEEGLKEPGSPPGHVDKGRNVRECSAMSCDPNPCGNKAECVDIGALIFCKCTDTWKGMFCTDKTTICDVNHTCTSGSTCLPTSPGGHRCICPLGKKGVNCEEDITISDALFVGEESFMAFQPVYIKKSVDVHLNIKPTKSTGLLFYVALRLHSNSGDFLSITLSDWTVEMRFSLGSDLNVIKSEVKLNGRIDEWHAIHVGRNSTHGYVSINGNITVSLTTGSMLYLDTTTDFYLGGLPSLGDASPLAFQDEPIGFEGCIREFMVNGRSYQLSTQGALSGRNIQDCDGYGCGYAVCKNGGQCHVTENDGFNCTCADSHYGDTCALPIECRTHLCVHGNCVPGSPYSCDCYLGWMGEYCNEETELGTSITFQRASHVVFQAASIDYKNVTVISLSFKTIELHGLIFWNGQTYTDDDDFLGVGLFEGRVKLVWNLGWYSRTETITTARYNDGRWHSLVINRQGQQMTFTVDDTTYNSRVSGDFYQLDTGPVYYLGGFKDGDVNDQTLENYHAPFDGCLKDVSINGHVLKFDEAADGLNIETCDQD